MKHKVGDAAWYPKFAREPVRIDCPDCGGDRFVRVIVHDGTEFKADCACCQRGLEGPRGHIDATKLVSEPTPTVIMGAEIGSDEQVSYKLSAGTGGYWTVKEEDLCLTEEAARTKCEQRLAEEEADVRRREFAKEKDTRSWAWHVTYHRRQMRECQERADYHAKKLGIAKEMKKKHAE